MAEIENDVENNEQNDVEQEVQDNPLASTGSEQWDKIIDEHAGLGEKKDEKSATTGTLTLNKDAKAGQTDKPLNEQQRQQAIDDANKQRQSTPQDQQNQQARATPRKYGDSFALAADGNIYDARGALVAKNGTQRMIFHRLYPMIETQQRQLAGLQSTVRNYEEANSIAKKEGLSLDEHGAALQMFVQWKKDPVKTMQTLLTLAEQSGRDVSSIKQSTGPSMQDFRAAVAEEVANAVKPFTFLTEQQAQVQREAELHSQVQNEYSEFVEEFPDAVLHTDALANVMRDKNINAREAYYAVRAFAATRGLDWTKPLAPQLVAADKGTPPGDGQNRGQALPRMGGRNVREDTHVENGALDQSNANDSWDSIAKKAMRKAGIAI